MNLPESNKMKEKLKFHFDIVQKQNTEIRIKLTKK